MSWQCQPGFRLGIICKYKGNTKRGGIVISLWKRKRGCVILNYLGLFTFESSVRWPSGDVQQARRYTGSGK